MGFLSQAGHLGLKTQSSKGSFADPAAPDTDEVQTLTPTGVTAGTFTLTFSGQTTAPIAYNANAATIQTALLLLPNLNFGDVVVSGGPMNTTPVLLTFGGAYAGTNVPLVTVDVSALNANEVQHVDVDATSGNFTITFSGQTTANINAATADATAVQNALVALSNIAAGDVTVTGGPADAGATTPFVLTFGGAYAHQNVPAVTATNVSLAGGGATVTVGTTTVGGSSQGAIAVATTDGGGAGVFVRFRSGAMGGNRELLVPDPEIGGNRDVPDAQLGPISFSGEFDIYPRMESLATMLGGALGDVAVATGDTASGFTHVITPGDTLPWISVEEAIANGYEAFNYTDAKVNTLHLESDANGYLMGTVGLIALTQALNASPTDTADQRVDVSPLLVGTNVNVLYGGVALPAKSFSLDINNNIEDDDFRLGSLFLGDLVEKRREITMSVTIRPEDSALWRQAMWGSPTATQPLGQSFKDDVSIVITSYDDITDADPGVKYSLTFTIPSAVIEPFSLNPSGDDVLQHDLSIRAVRPDPTVDILTATIRNSYSTVA